jgi:putative ABC transport system permease protein
MYVIGHALLNIGKNAGRNILTAIIIITVIAASTAALSIYNTSGIIIEETRSALLCAVRVAPRRQTVGGGGAITAGGARQDATLSSDDYRSFAESPYIDGADIKETGRGADGVEAVYYLKKPDMLAEFEMELRSKGLPDDYAVRTDESLSERTAGPVESLRNLSFAFLLIVLSLGAVIMILLSAITVRERKYEIGVLRAMGMKKKSVALGLITEIVAITCVCFALGLVAGSALSQPVSDAILTGRQNQQSSGSTTLAERLNGSVAEQSMKIDVSVSAATAFEIFGIAVVLASAAGLVSVARITKYEPIKILTERG